MIPGLSAPIPGFSPDFFKPSPLTERPSAGVSLSDGQSLSEFVESPEFKQFEREFREHVASIQAFASRHLSETSAEHVCAAFQQLADRLFDTDYDFFGAGKHTLYGVGKRSLQAFDAHLSNPAIDLAIRQSCLMELASGIQECADGAAGNLQDATKLFDLALGSPFLRARDEVATASINEAYLHLTTDGNPIEITFLGKHKTVDSIPTAYEAHAARSLRNAMAEGLGMPRLTDPTADLFEFPPESVAYCGRLVAKHLTPARLALNLAEEYLNAVRQAVFTLFGTKGADGMQNPHQIFDRRQIREAASQIEKDRKDYGAIRFESVFTPQDEDGVNVRINTDPALIALDILAQQRRNGFLARAYVPETLAHWRHDGKNISIRQIDGIMAWALEDGVPRSLSCRHLMLICPKDFRGREDIPKLLVATVIENTPPETLRTRLPLNWLSISDTPRLFSKWTPEEFTAFLERNQASIARLPLNRKRRIARGVVCRGRPSDLDFCGLDGSRLFGPPAGQAHRPAFFGLALLRGDPPMLNRLLDLFKEGWNESESIKAHATAILASADEHGTPALAEALTRRHPNPALPRYYDILMQAAGSGIIGANELEQLLDGRDRFKIPALGYPIRSNIAEHIGAFCAALIEACVRGHIDAGQFCSVLSAKARDIPAIFIAAAEGCTEIVRIIGTAVVAAHRKKIIDGAQVLELLSARIHHGWTALRAAIGNGDPEMVMAYGDVLTLAMQEGALTYEDGDYILQDAAAMLEKEQEEPLEEGQLAAVAAFIEFRSGYGREQTRL